MSDHKPTASQERIISLDVLRGFALMGILIMNIISIGMVSSNYLNPMAEGQLSFYDEIAFIFSQLFADQKFMSIFSILFGAGVILITERAIRANRSPAIIHYSRNFWLLLIGLFHAYIIWFGDILVPYALCSIWVFLFRNKTPKTLFIIASILFLVTCSMSLMSGFSIPYWSDAELAELCLEWVPTPDMILYEIAAYQGAWSDHFPLRSSTAFNLETFVFSINYGWHVTGLMLIGMGLYKLGILSAERDSAFYKKLFFISFSVGMIIGLAGLYFNYRNNWSCQFSFFIGSQFNFAGSLPMALSYIALIMLLIKSSAGQSLSNWLAPIGRMALTNYIMQSVLASFIFYGYGFGLFGQKGRAELWLYIVLIWVFQLVLSRWWMSKFKFGPLEWLWRTLTYRKFQKFFKP